MPRVGFELVVPRLDKPRLRLVAHGVWSCSAGPCMTRGLGLTPAAAWQGWCEHALRRFQVVVARSL